MGTRADFYVGKDNMEWLGSTAWDGYLDGIPEAILTASDVDSYRAAVAEHLARRDDATLPEDGWPWPWRDSNTTDYAYTFDDGVHFSRSGDPWRETRLGSWPDDEDPQGEAPQFPNMTAIRNVTLGERSGLTIITGRK